MFLISGLGTKCPEELSRSGLPLEAHLSLRPHGRPGARCSCHLCLAHSNPA